MDWLFWKGFGTSLQCHKFVFDHLKQWNGHYEGKGKREIQNFEYLKNEKSCLVPENSIFLMSNVLQKINISFIQHYKFLYLHTTLKVACMSFNLQNFVNSALYCYCECWTPRQDICDRELCLPSISLVWLRSRYICPLSLLRKWNPAIIRSNYRKEIKIV